MTTNTLAAIKRRIESAATMYEERGDAADWLAGHRLDRRLQREETNR